HTSPTQPPPLTVAKAGAAAATVTAGTAHTPVRTTARLLGLFIGLSPVPCVPRTEWPVADAGGRDVPRRPAGRHAVAGRDAERKEGQSAVRRSRGHTRRAWPLPYVSSMCARSRAPRSFPHRDPCGSRPVAGRCDRVPRLDVRPGIILDNKGAGAPVRD